MSPLSYSENYQSNEACALERNYGSNVLVTVQRNYRSVIVALYAYNR